MGLPLMSHAISNRRHGRQTFGGERGQALIEFALVLPLVLILIFGVIDVGKAVSYWNDETHLANEAARYVSVNNSGDSNWSTCVPNGGNSFCAAYKVNTWIKSQAETTELGSGGGSIPSGITVCIWFPGVAFAHNVGDAVQVKITATYQWLNFLLGKFGGLPATLTAKSTMRLEQKYKADGTDAYTTGIYTGGPGIIDGSGTC
jgi:hypothetical protein